MEYLIGLLIVVGIVIYNLFSWSYVAIKFYGWFVLVNFPTLPHVSYMEMLGVMLFISVLTHKRSTHIKNEYEDSQLKWVSLIFGPWIVLVIGWIIQGIWF